uniref:Uncharacterized protein n=1 Tax=Myoviridae sp. ctIty1 TaxID=2827673 RepID=A0A8S5TGZ9_9CAUD|nr:MAG TPA: hypothetical protein [Myoviridae sp. ctIty1]
MEKVEMVIMENFESKSNKRIYSVPNYYRFNELSANIIIKDPKGKKPDTLLKLDGQELYDNIKLFDLKKLTGLDRINNMVPIIDLFGKMLINTILIKDYRALYFGNERVFKDSNIRKIENVIEYISCIEDCGNIALRGDINSLKNFIKTVISYNFCVYRKDMIGVFNYTYLGNGEGLEEDLDGIKESKDKQFDIYVFPELKEQLEFAADITNRISETNIVQIKL